MRRLLVLYMFTLLSSSTFAFGEFAPAVVQTIVLDELAAMRLPPNSPVCLAILPARDTSDTGADPSSQLLRFLARRGMRARKASTCYNPPPKGKVISIELIKESTDRFSAKVTFSDVAIAPERDLGILHRRGIYELVKGDNGKWVVKSSVGEFHN
jgi:hypothetical protein